MKKPNAYLQRRQIEHQTYLDVGEQFGMQKMWDYIQIVLHDPAVMGKDTFGEKRLCKIFDAMKVVSSEYHTAFTPDKEADYYQEKLDAQLREIYGGKMIPFYERYPELKRITYDKPKKGWI